MASEQIVVADSTPLIALARVARLDLLHRLVKRVVIPPAVQAEIRAGGIHMRQDVIDSILRSEPS